MSSDLDTAFALRPDVVITVLEEGALLLDLESKYFYSVNSTGWSIVQRFEAGSSLRAVTEQSRDWGAPDGDLESVRLFVDVLRKDRLVEASGAIGESQIAPPSSWIRPVIEKHKDPLQRVMTSAFDPSVPLAE